MERYIEVYKALSDKTRLRIIRLLLQAKSALCVCEFVDSLEESQYNVSRHLKVLKHAGLVSGKKEGRWVYYSFGKGKDKFIEQVLKSVQLVTDPALKKDEKELRQRIQLRERGKCLIGIQKKHLLPFPK